jgi:putative holliday junction resolvase
VRVLALDLGARRIGVAVSDRSGTLASPYEVIARSGSVAADHTRVARMVEEVGAERVVVGLPLSLDGSTGPAARKALAEVDQLAAAVGVPVETIDERFSTVTADRSMVERGMKAPARRKVVDQVAAAVLLQTWLDGRPRPQHRSTDDDE